MDSAVVATVFAVVFAAELPDKTAVASLIMSTRFKAAYVFAGVAVAFAVHTALAVAAGSLVARLPHRLLGVIVGAVFLIGALLLVRRRADPGEVQRTRQPSRPSFLKVAAASFAVIIVAEFGDITEILIANFAAKYHDPVPVAVGAVLALWLAAGLAIIGGRALSRVIPLTLISRLAAALMAVLGVLSLVSAANA
jgi:Ca2+/H+ antiporter, TMEM165/GDT1 family